MGVSSLFLEVYKPATTGKGRCRKDKHQKRGTGLWDLGSFKTLRYSRMERMGSGSPHARIDWASHISSLRLSFPVGTN